MPEQERFSTEEFEHGLRCMDCEDEFVEGQPIAERPYAMDTFAMEPMVCVELVCVPCSLSVVDRG